MTAPKHYSFYGYENGWQRQPMEVVLCKGLNHQLRTEHYPDCTHEVICDICQIYWKYDSGD